MAIESISKVANFSRIVDATSNVANLTTKINTLETNVKASLAKKWTKTSDSYGGGTVLSNLNQLTNGPKYQSVQFLPSDSVNTLPWFYVVSITNNGTMSSTDYIFTRNSSFVFDRAYSGGKYLPVYSDYRATISLLPGYYMVDYQLFQMGHVLTYNSIRTASSINYYSGNFWVVHPDSGINSLQRNWMADSIYLWHGDTGKSNDERTAMTTRGYAMIKVGTSDSTTPVSCTFQMKLFATSGYNFVPCLALGAKFIKVADISS